MTFLLWPSATSKIAICLILLGPPALAQADCLWKEPSSAEQMKALERLAGVVKVTSDYPLPPALKERSEMKNHLAIGAGIVIKKAGAGAPEFVVATAAHLVGGTTVHVLPPLTDTLVLESLARDPDKYKGYSSMHNESVSQVLFRDIKADVAIIDWPSSKAPSSYFHEKGGKLLLSSTETWSLHHNHQTSSEPSEAIANVVQILNIESLAIFKRAEAPSFDEVWAPKIPWACQAIGNVYDQSPDDFMNTPSTDDFEKDFTGQFQQVRATLPFGYSGAPIVESRGDLWKVDNQSHELIGLVTQFHLLMRRTVLATSEHILDILQGRILPSEENSTWKISEDGTLVRFLSGVPSSVIESSAGKAFVGDPGNPTPENSNQQASYSFLRNDGTEIFGYQVHLANKGLFVFAPDARSARQIDVLNKNKEISKIEEVINTATLGKEMAKRHNLGSEPLLFEGCILNSKSPVDLNLSATEDEFIFKFTVYSEAGCDSWRIFRAKGKEFQFILPKNLIDPLVGVFVPVYSVEGGYRMDLTELIYSQTFNNPNKDPRLGRIFFSNGDQLRGQQVVLKPKKSN